jgi:hypothetical protein
VDPDVATNRFGPGVIKDGHGRCSRTPRVAQVHHEVADLGVADIEEVQPGFAPVQQACRSTVVKITGHSDARDGSRSRNDNIDRVEVGCGGWRVWSPGHHCLRPERVFEKRRRVCVICRPA